MALHRCGRGGDLDQPGPDEAARQSFDFILDTAAAPHDLDQSCDRMVKSDVEYRFGIDMTTLAPA